MKCSVGQDEWYPMLSIADKKYKSGEHDVPPRMIRALEQAWEAVDEAERDIIRHLQKTGQEYPHAVAHRLEME